MYIGFLCQVIAFIIFFYIYSNEESFIEAFIYGSSEEDNAFKITKLAFAILAIGKGAILAFSIPLIISHFSHQKIKWLNKLYASFILGTLVTTILADSMPFLKYGNHTFLIVFVFLIASAVLLIRSPFPVQERVAAGVSNLEARKSIHKPLFYFLLLVGLLTGLMKVGFSYMYYDGIIINQVFLPFIFAIGFIAQFFIVGPLVKQSNSLKFAVMLISMFSIVLILFFATNHEGFFIVWVLLSGFLLPTILGLVSEQFPKGGSLALLSMVAMSSLGVWIGRSLIHDKMNAMIYSFLILVIITIFFFVWPLSLRKKGGYKKVEIPSIETMKN